MDSIRYQFGAIAQASDDIRSTSMRINAQLDELKAQITPMTAEWEGESSTAYQAAQRQWDNSAAEINTILATIANAVGDGNTRMNDANSRAASSWGM